MKLSDWGRRERIHCQAAWKWFEQGTLPVPADQTAVGTILLGSPVHERAGGVVPSARVSSWDRRNDLDPQVGRLAAWAIAQGLGVAGTVAEVGWGLYGWRSRLKRLLAEGAVGSVVVVRRERLARFGVEECVEVALRARPRGLLVVEEREVDDDLVGEITAVLASMCARLYGRGSARGRAERAVTAAREAG